MRIRIDVEVPKWTQWLAAGIVGGLVLGSGAARVSADTTGVRTDFAPHEPLRAQDLNNNFTILNNAVQQLERADCPLGFARDTAETSIVLCKNGTDEMVRVVSGGARFCIDRYEASIWEKSGGTGRQYGLTENDLPTTFPSNGQYTTALFARSVAGVTPSAWVSWFAADAACEASSKRLPTSSEWMRAARGTPDEGSSAGGSGTCLTSTTTVRATGQGVNCVSMWGAQDLIGNLYEYAAEWQMAPTTSNAYTPWPNVMYNGDYVFNVASSAADANGYHVGLPSATLHGGSFATGIGAGIFALNLSMAPSYGNGEIGFRCVVTR